MISRHSAEDYSDLTIGMTKQCPHAKESCHAITSGKAAFSIVNSPRRGPDPAPHGIKFPISPLIDITYQMGQGIRPSDVASCSSRKWTLAAHPATTFTGTLS